MNVPPIQPIKPQPTFGICDSRTLKWLKSKLKYIQDGIKKIMRSKAK